MNYHFTCLVARFLLCRIPFAQRALLILLLTTGLGLFGSQHITSPQPVYAAAMEVDRLDDEPSATACTAAVNDCSLRGAILAANSLAGPDTINVPAGTYTLTTGSELILASEITLVGAGAATTIVQASTSYNTASHRVMSVRSGATVIISGLTIRYGRATSSGGGIYNDSGVLTLQDRTVVSANLAGSYGGGIYNTGTLTVTGPGTIIGGDSRIGMGNSARAWYGGGIYNTGTVTIEGGAALSGNLADNLGGGIYNNRGIVTVTGSGTIIGGNSAAGLGNSARSWYGGGIYNNSGTVTIEGGAAVSGNTARGAGGIYNHSGTVTVSGPGTIIGGNSTAGLGNSATLSSGGGIYSYRGTLTISDSAAVSGNSATDNGGGIGNYDGTLMITGTGTIIGGDRATGLGNSAGWGGGGIDIYGGTVTIQDGAAISGNMARDGGGIYNITSATVIVTDSILSDNQGSAWYNGNLVTQSITGSCIVNNSPIGVEAWGTPRLEASGNWWGATNGPGPEGPGSGDRITSGVDISGGFLTAPPAGLTCATTSITLTGTVYRDDNNNGIQGGSEPGISGVTITASGTDSQGMAVTRTTTTAADGTYRFELPAGTYSLTETQPGGYIDGLDAVGSLGGTLTPPDTISAIVATTQGASATNYNFGERWPILTVNGPLPIPEGDSGETNATFTITLSAWANVPVSVHFATGAVGDTAQADIDYTSTSGELSFTSSTLLSQSISVPVRGDRLDEADETLTLTLSDATNAIISGRGTDTGTIIDDDTREIVVAVTDNESSESGDTASFNVHLATQPTAEVIISFTNSDPSEGAAPGSITFTTDNWQTDQPVTVTGVDDDVDDGDILYTVTLSAGGGDYTGQTAQAALTNLDDDEPPSIGIDNVTIMEGNSGTTDATFTVSLSHPAYQTVTVNYAAVDDSATTSDNDYGAAAGRLTFAPEGPLTQTVTVRVNGDLKFEPDETFFVNLSNVSYATLEDTQGIGTITNDDNPPQLSIDGVSVAEGNSGTVNANFTVSLSHATYQTVTVDYATADGSATTADYDYVGVSDTLTFTPNDLSEIVTVTVNGDTKLELDETFFVNLSNPNNASIGDGQGIGTIRNDDSAPQISIDDVSVIEGNSGTVDATFTVSLSNLTYQTITVGYATADDSATTADNDYAAASGTLTFAPDDLSETITVTVNGDLTFELDETFFVNLNNPNNASIEDGQGIGTIINDEGVPQLSIDDVNVKEGNSGTINAVFTVSLSKPTYQTVTLDYATTDDSATTANNDYSATSGTLTFAPNDLSETITVMVNGDTTFEPDETFFVNLSNPVNASIADAQGVGTIRNDDAIPQLSVNDVRVTEGHSGEVKAMLAVTLSHPTYRTVTVEYANADDSATVADGDYRGRAGTLTFAPGTVRKTVVVTVYGDTRYELDESFRVILSGARFATVSDNQGVGTIVNDDAPPVLSIDDVMVFERGSGKGRAVFTVSLAMPIGLPVTVSFASADGTATVSSDYAPAAGTLTFTPGVTNQTVIVSTLSDTLAEGAETFFLNLSQPTNATIGDAQGIATIRDQVPVLRAPANQSDISDNTPTLIWNTLRDATHYRLQLDNNADFSSPLVTRVLNGTRYTPTTILPDQVYYWRVQARDAFGNWGGWSSRWSFTVDTISLATPVLLSPINGIAINGNRPVFRWQAVSGATSYTLQVDDQSTFVGPVINTTTVTTSYSPTTPLAAGTYYWRVRAQDTAGHQSRWSSPWRFTIASAAVLPLSPAEATHTSTPISTEGQTMMSTPTAIVSATVIPTEPVSSTLLRVESTDPVVVQTGTWTAHATSAASGGSYLYSSGSFDDALSLSFSGTQVEVIYVKHPALGTFAVEVDGVAVQLVNSGATESEFGAQVVASGLAAGPHTISVYPVAGVVAIDAFGVETLVDLAATPTPTDVPPDQPTMVPTDIPPDQPTEGPTNVPSDQPTLTPTATSTPLPVMLPFMETFDSGLNWQPTGAWTFDTQTAYQGAGWFAESSMRGQSSTLTFSGQLDLRTALKPEVSFWCKASLSSSDVFAVELSLDGGSTWQPLDQQAGQVIDWTQYSLDLSAYRGQVIMLRFWLDTMNVLPEGAITVGVWIDDLVIQEDLPTPTVISTSEVTDQPSSTPVPPTMTDLPRSTPVPSDTPLPTVPPTSTLVPTETPTMIPTATLSPSETPTETPTTIPTVTEPPTETPMPSDTPTELPTDETLVPNATEKPAS